MQKHLAEKEEGLQFKQSFLIACNQQLSRGAAAASSSHHKFKIKIAVWWNWTIVRHVKLLTKLWFCKKLFSRVSWDSLGYFRVSIGIYIISSVMHAFWLILTYDLLEDRRIDDVIIKTFLNSLLYKTNRFQVAVCLFSNRLQRTSKCGKNISDTLSWASCATFLFLPHFDVICDLLLNRHMAIWNLFVKLNDTLTCGHPKG